MMKHLSTVTIVLSSVLLGGGCPNSIVNPSSGHGSGKVVSINESYPPPLPPPPETIQPQQQETQAQLDQTTKVSQLLSTCQRHFEVGRLSGGNGTALTCYKKVLEIDRTNAQAIAGLAQIETRYVELIQAALKEEQLEEARQYLANLRTVSPGSPKLKQLKAKLSTLESQLQAKTPPPVVTCQQTTTQPNNDRLPAGKVFRDCLKDGSLGPEMVWIPAGSFRMGDRQGNGGSDEKPIHSVSVARMAMGQYEVTFAEYDKFAKATGRKKPDDYGWGRDNRPVISVSWDDAVAYTKWLSQQTGKQYRLPTEAEWEYATRAGTKTARYWGNNPDKACHYANVKDQTFKDALGWTEAHNCRDGYVHTAPVGSFKPNKFGLFDMLGNVWEWTCSEYESQYDGKEQVCVKNADRISQRGGDWFDKPSGVRAAIRSWKSSKEGNEPVGFRLVRL